MEPAPSQPIYTNRVWNVIAHKLKRLWQRIRIYSIRKTDPWAQDWGKSDPEERRMSSIIRRMIKKPESELLLSPMSSRYFIRNDKNQMLIIFSEGEARVINHVYGYTVKISPKAFKSLYSTFISEVEIRRDKLEEQYQKNVNDSLQNIISDMEK